MPRDLQDTSDLLSGVKKILVTGGAGFIGGSLIRKLLKESDVEIFNLDKLNYSSDLSSIDTLLNKLEGSSEGRYKFLKVDLCNSSQTSTTIQTADPDLVFHLAAESHVDRSIDNPNIFIESNIIGTYNLLNGLRSHYEKIDKVRKANFRLHHISTDEVFGSLGDKGRFKETTPYAPRSPYSATKAASDHLVNAWHHTYGIPTILTNCSNNFGPFQFPEKLIPIVILKAISGEEIPLYGDGKNIRDWLFVEDHIEALLLAATRGKPGSNYCIGGSNEKSNLQIVEEICKILDQRLNPISSYTNLIKMVEDRPGHDRRYAIDSSLITNELNWIPRHTFEESLEKTVDWYLKNLSWCKEMQRKSSYKGERLGLQEN